MFLIKELRLLAKQKNLDIKYFNLYFKDNELDIEESDDLYSLNNLSILNESISQFTREIDLYDPSFVEKDES